MGLVTTFGFAKLRRVPYSDIRPELFWLKPPPEYYRISSFFASYCFEDSSHFSAHYPTIGVVDAAKKKTCFTSVPSLRRIDTRDTDLVYRFKFARFDPHSLQSNSFQSRLVFICRAEDKLQPLSGRLCMPGEGMGVLRVMVKILTNSHCLVHSCCLRVASKNISRLRPLQQQAIRRDSLFVTIRSLPSGKPIRRHY